MHRADINGRAAAIECYLDLGENPVIRWTEYNKEIDAYHGEIEGRPDSMRRFLELKEAADGYDFTKIEAVLSVIIQNCVAMREAERLADIEKELAATPDDADEEERTRQRPKGILGQHYAGGRLPGLSSAAAALWLDIRQIAFKWGHARNAPRRVLARPTAIPAHQRAG